MSGGDEEEAEPLGSLSLMSSGWNPGLPLGITANIAPQQFDTLGWNSVVSVDSESVQFTARTGYYRIDVVYPNLASASCSWVPLNIDTFTNCSAYNFFEDYNSSTVYTAAVISGWTDPIFWSIVLKVDDLPARIHFATSGINQSMDQYGNITITWLGPL